MTFLEKRETLKAERDDSSILSFFSTIDALLGYICEKNTQEGLFSAPDRGRRGPHFDRIKLALVCTS